MSLTMWGAGHIRPLPEICDANKPYLRKIEVKGRNDKVREGTFICSGCNRKCHLDNSELNNASNCERRNS